MLNRNCDFKVKVWDKEEIVEIIENIQFKAAKGLSLSVFLAGGGKNSLNLASENLSSLIFLAINDTKSTI